MKKLLFIVSLLVGEIINAQNLVSNPGFEIFNTCPTSSGQITFATSWFQPFLLGSSTDFFHSCSATTAVPNNPAGYQFGHSPLGYGGIITVYFLGNNYREYLEVGLTDTLHSGTEYCVSFYVSLAENFSKLSVDGLGAYFSSDSVFYSTPFLGLLPYQPQIQSTAGNIINDTANWVLISDTFIASGGEKFITIGNFKSDAQTTISNNNFGTDSAAYYYIDDISVVQGPCGVGMEEHETNDQIKFYPNPTDGLLNITCADNTLVTIYDLQGRFIKSAFLKNGEINISELEAGCYVLKVKNQHELITVK